MLRVLFIAVFSLSPTILWAKTSKCEDAHKKALSMCMAYEHNITASQIKALSKQTRVRVAEKETDKLYSMGRACSEAQNVCKKTCSSNSAINSTSLDVTELFELQSDCSEGQIAEHRSKLADRYLKMKAILEETRTPATAE